MNAKEFESTLSRFTGLEDYHRHPLMRNVYATDGAEFVFRNGGKEIPPRKEFQEFTNNTANWLFDLIASWLHKTRSEPFQVWKLERRWKNKKHTKCDWLASCEDGNGHVVAKQVIEYSDFMLDEITLWMEYGSIDGVNPAWIIMIPSER